MNRVIMKGVRAARRVVVAVVGTTVVLVGLALVVLPGPAFVVVPIGLGILALEFAWAKRLLQRAREYYLKQTRNSFESVSGQAEEDSSQKSERADR